ncbi:MAG TPA: OsmC family protein [Gammaproteobacteria bacterium]|nr:OsmC family protein [Gammaproteobacteria bacterium]
MQAKVRWLENALFVGESSSGHALVMDGPPEHGGRNLGPRPMEMLVLGMGACAAFDVVHILQKARQSVTDCVVQVDAERADEVPAVFTKIHLHFLVEGEGLKDAAVKRAVNLSAEKYCSASIMLGKTAEVTHSFEVTQSK